MIEEFDARQHLRLMEELVPLAFDQLIKLANSILENDGLEEVVIALLDFLSEATKFNFLFKTFEKKFVEILYLMCYPLLGPDRE
jgi:hypothetical protein